MSHNNFETIAIHAGQAPDPQTGAVVPAIVNASTFTQDGVGNLRGGFEYARRGNPTRNALETLLAAIESVDLPQNERRLTSGFAFASGLAA